VCSRY
jgi:ribonuclease HI